MYRQPRNPPPYPFHGPSSSNNEMGQIENMFKQKMENNVDSYSQLRSHNTSIRNLEVQMGKISQALNSLPKRALLSDTVVNPKGGNNMGHAMAVTTRSGRGRNAPTSSRRNLVDDEQVVQEEEIPNNVVQPNDEVRIDIDDSVEETQEEVKPSREHIINIPEPEQIPGYAKFMKDLVTKKRSMNFETIKVTHQVSAILHSMAPKLEDLDFGDWATKTHLCEIANDRSYYERPLGVIEDILVRVDKFILPEDFVILDCEVDYEVPIIRKRPFLTMGKAFCDVEAGELTF
ncbi:uncharacterized protein [Nicotiana sylvestris]|uniref:uncharacterized protein n=1 Tax=Nicotiana sylvestris TaxID=4096 RepID=UPI00388CAE8E